MSKKPIRLKPLPKKQKHAMAALVIVAMVIIVYGWATTMKGVFKTEAKQAKNNIEASFEDLSDNFQPLKNPAINVAEIYKEGMETSKTVAELKQQKEIEDQILSSIKEKIENDYGQEKEGASQEE